MRKLITTLLVLSSYISFSQVPMAFNYQAVLRDVSGEIITNTEVSIEVSIIQGAPTGESVFSEAHTAETNDFGLVNLQIGSINTIDFSSIDWAAGPYFLQINLNGMNMGTSQLLSVPFALHAKTAEGIIGADTKHYIGELYGGGIVFWVTPDGQHGLIVSLDDLDEGNGIAWSNMTDVEIGPSAQSMTDGASNTAAIIAQEGHTSGAAKLCADYSGGGFTDWYLPSNRELYLLASQDILIDNLLDNDGDSNTNGFSQEWILPIYGSYWSSTESYDKGAYGYYFNFGNSGSSSKDNTFKVRAIRAF